MGLLLCLEATQSFPIKASFPRLLWSTFVEVGSCGWFYFSVETLLSSSSKAQVFKSIVLSVSVDVVNRKFSWILTRHPCPSQAMRSIRF